MRPVSGQRGQARGACRDCLRRSWLLGELSALLDYRRADPDRLMALMELGDEPLIEALAGRRRVALSASWKTFDPGMTPRSPNYGELCRHSPQWPARMRRGPAPAMLWLSPDAPRFAGLLGAATVALVTSPDPSPYGAAMGASLARGLAAAGVTVLAPLHEGGPAHRGTIEGRGASLALAADGLARVRPASAERLSREIARQGCIIAELPPHSTGRSWGGRASQRTLACLADLVVVVEARAHPVELLGASIAASLGRPLAALPGQATSSRSEGPHRLIREGAELVRDAGDVLEMLPPRPEDPQRPQGSRAEAAHLGPATRALLERLGSGEDTPERLGRGARDPGKVMTALGELEASGLVRRLAGGRYVVLERTPGSGRGR